MTEQEKQLRAFIGSRVKYDDNGTMIWGGSANDLQLLADVRGWGAIQNLPQFKNDKTQNAAAEFQDALGQFIADAINEKISLSDRDKFAIGFAEWLKHSDYESLESTNNVHEYGNIWNNESMTYAISELLDLYKQSLTKTDKK